ncbi:MAG: LytR family transcriptional regulator, partial [Scardovia wiggsiae]|nr:LytR family transcriptional regulator [Scardovia wiggsiae]
KSESDKAAAEAVAQQLGIASVSQKTNIAAPVVVIVR